MKRKTYIVKNKFRFYSFLAIMTIIIFISVFFLISSNAKALKSTEYKRVKVYEGDTIWDIASEQNIKTDIRKYIYEIRKINNLDNAEIKPGDILKIPIVE